MSEIGRRINRDKSTISRELSRNKNERLRVYLPDTVQEKMKIRCKQAKVRFQSVSSKMISEIKQRLEQHHSPEQLTGRMKREGLGKISYETIYLMIYANHQAMGIYQQYLRQKQKQRRRKGQNYKRGGIPSSILMVLEALVQLFPILHLINPYYKVGASWLAHTRLHLY